MTPDEIVAAIRRLFQERGDSMYGGEAVTQREHALQAATLAEREGADAYLITAAFLHDIGHLLHDLPEDSTAEGVNDAHEELAHQWLAQHFDAKVVEPVRMHVDAKRYLCAVDPSYSSTLSDVSQQSLRLQGGPFGPDEAREFEQHPHLERCVRLRRWDDRAKVVDLETPNVEHFLVHVQRALHDSTSADPMS